MLSKDLPDVQLTKPKHKIAINRVGISDFKMPIFISQKDGGVQHSVANISCYVDLAPDIKGISMSRIPIGLMKFANEQLSSKLIESISENIRIISEAKTCELTYNFPYFLTKLSPSNMEPGIVSYNVSFIGIKSINDFRFNLCVETIATSCCPCSKEISKYGAHNQKSFIKINCKTKENCLVWIESIIDIAEKSSSCEIYSILKRPDEAKVTEKAYENPKFVEDIARECYFRLDKIEDIDNFDVEVSNDESIHIHKAIAKISNY
jgi:GTP cyclohydrolase IB